ncbi:putative tricarboxylic transport membrane protein [Neorhizobium galegae]|uniref:tripartite tricarboxylate transporter permease n=1 Tax=Neorhizobium galegae TaxID=399 RepID=UPI002785A46D|nr:tripartite tricarboxylate transporter permease [Neorhizobium galegae]MDQ0137741.1 putative tricarboxylic transport membrane protein [Neorhizobium galegae]
MMELLPQVYHGFATLLSVQHFAILGLSIPIPIYIVLCFVGCLIGTLVGILPGLGPVATVSILLPITLQFDVVGALIMLAGIYYGAQYGGSTTAILMRIPGEVTSVVSVIDGHEMARQGRAGPALGIAAIGSFIAGTIGTAMIVLFSAPLMKVALMFGPAEYCALIIMGLILAVVLASGSLVKALGMVSLGILLSTVGLDQETGLSRMTFGASSLADGIDFSVLALGLFGFTEILRNLEVSHERSMITENVSSPYPSWLDLRVSIWPILRGTFIGGALGILPGSGGALGPFASYAVEKRLAKEPGRFGSGAIEGLAGPESANNAGAQTSFIPMLTLGLPPTALMALLVGAMTIQGVVPGPQVMTRNPELFWGLIASMWIGNLMLLVINLPLVGIWIKLLKIPYRFLYPLILLVSAIGLYSIANSEMAIIYGAIFGLVGYLFFKVGFEPAPLLLGFVLGSLLEENLRRALTLSSGSLFTFVEKPISAGLILVAAISLVVAVFSTQKRNAVFVED